MSRDVKITYKSYRQGEQWFLTPSLDELVPENHFVRTVSKTESIDILLYDRDLFFKTDSKAVPQKC